MSIHIHWHIEGRIIYATIIGEIGINDLKQASDQIVALIEESHAPLIHLLVDETQAGAPPKPDLKPITDALQVFRHPRMGWLIVFGNSGNRLARLITYMVSQLGRLRFRRFDTLQESLEFLYSMDTSLPSRAAHSESAKFHVH